MVILNIIGVVLGIGLVILVHELGHFLAARFSGVRVEAFSIGFGPVLLSRRRGDTEYRISLIPLGGYVKMAGEAIGEGKGDRDELFAKTPPYRLLIFAAGVVMNVILAVALFILVFSVGVPFAAPVVGRVEKGGAAWKAGLPAGSRILSVNGKAVNSFKDIAVNVALGDEEILVLAQTGEEDPREYRMRPEKDTNLGFMRIQVDSTVARVTLKVKPDSQAAKAGFKDKDRLVSLGGLEVTGDLVPLLRRREELDGQPIEMKVRRTSPDGGEKELSFTVQPEGTPGKRFILGVKPAVRKIKAIHPDLASANTGLEVDDVILAVAGRPVLGEKDLTRALTGREGTVPFTILRKDKVLELAFKPGPTFVDRLALTFDRSAVVPQPEGNGARAGLQPGDLLKRIGEQEITEFTQLSKAVQEIAAAAGEGPVQVALQVERKGRVLDLQAQLSRVIDHDYGFAIQPHPLEEVVKRKNLVAAVKLGLSTSWNTLKQVYVTLVKVAGGSVDVKNLGGPITIFRASHTLIEQGLFKFLWFLAVISINLAFINILPIPVLDGGHILFLLVEWIKGSPVSERVMTWFQLAGLVVILSLILFVTYNDILRWAGWQ